MTISETFLRAEYALLHGEDSEGRRTALEAWKARHVDPEWADFSLLVCAEGCPWAEVQNALLESAPLGASRVVLVPQAENLLEKPKELPPTIKALLERPLPDTRLLLVSRTGLSAGPGRTLGAKPFSEWVQQGRVLKVGALDEKEAPAYVEAQAQLLGLKLDGGVAARIAARMGGNPGILTRTLEVLELLAENRRVSGEMVDQTTFRLGEQNAFAWSQAWQKGQLTQALATLRVALEDDPSDAPLRILGQARREVDRLCRLVEARAKGLRSPQELAGALGLTPRQAFLLDGYGRVLDRIKPAGAARLLRLINQTDLDLKGLALSGGRTPLVALTLSLCRAWVPQA
jgi:DNA polymerase III delta subunit